MWSWPLFCDCWIFFLLKLCSFLCHLYVEYDARFNKKISILVPFWSIDCRQSFLTCHSKSKENHHCCYKLKICRYSKTDRNRPTAILSDWYYTVLDSAWYKSHLQQLDSSMLLTRHTFYQVLIMTKDVLFTVLWKGHIINSFFDKKNTEKLQLIILLQNSIKSKIVKQVLV